MALLVQRSLAVDRPHRANAHHRPHAPCPVAAARPVAPRRDADASTALIRPNGRRSRAVSARAAASVATAPPAQESLPHQRQQQTQQQQQQQHHHHELILYRNHRGRVLRLRPYRPSDAQGIIHLQTDSFFHPPGLPALRAIAYANFKAEVTDSVRQKERTLRVDPEGFQVMVMEDVTAALRDAPPGLLPANLWQERASPVSCSRNNYTSSSAGGPEHLGATTTTAAAVAAAERPAATGAAGAGKEAKHQQQQEALLWVALPASQLSSSSALLPPPTATHLPPGGSSGGGNGASGQAALGDVQEQQQQQQQQWPLWDELLQGELIGTVEVTLMDELEVLRHLPTQPQDPQLQPGSGSSSSSNGGGSGGGRAEDYAYISSMAVSSPARRQQVAHALLHAAERLVRVAWRGQRHLALHVYEDNTPAVRLYHKCGFKVLDQDPSWKRLLGGRVRLLMHRALQPAAHADSDMGPSSSTCSSSTSSPATAAVIAAAVEDIMQMRAAAGDEDGSNDDDSNGDGSDGGQSVRRALEPMAAV